MSVPRRLLPRRLRQGRFAGRLPVQAAAHVRRMLHHAHHPVHAARHPVPDRLGNVLLLSRRERVIERGQRRALGVNLGQPGLEPFLFPIKPLDHVGPLAGCSEAVDPGAAIAFMAFGDIQADFPPAREQGLLVGGQLKLGLHKGQLSRPAGVDVLAKPAALRGRRHDVINVGWRRATGFTFQGVRALELEVSRALTP